MSFRRKSFNSVATSLGQVSGSFSLIDTVLSNLRLVDPHGSKFLLGHGKASRYRFCPVCLATDKVKYFRIEWRFRCWLWCPLHMCRLSDHCPSCSEHIHLPVDLINAGPEGWGVATLDRCLACEALLTENADSMRNTLDFMSLTDWEQCLLRNGRAVLAALLHGGYKVQTGQGSVRKAVKELGSLEKHGLIAHFVDMPEWVLRS